MKDKNYYSVPYHYITISLYHYLGEKVRIIYSEILVEIYYQSERIANHLRNKVRYTYTTNKEHMPSHHRFVSEWSSAKFISWAEAIGDDCKSYIIQILKQKQHPEQSYKSCLGILHLAKKVGNIRLNNACKRAAEYQEYRYNIIKRILEKGLDTLEDVNQIEEHIPLHKNIRSKNYYK